MGESHAADLLKRRILVLVGGYGAGKTQLSLNIALNRTRQHSNVALVDLDLVNPYFRSREAALLLEAEKIKVIRPEGALAFAETPSLVPEIEGVLRNKTWQVIVDVGGDPTGATVLGRYAPYLQGLDVAILQVVNLYRPFTRTISEIEFLCKEIEAKSRLNVQGWINNTNLQEWTELSEWVRAQETMNQLAEKTGIPVITTALNPEWAESVGLAMEDHWIRVKRYLRPKWQ